MAKKLLLDALIYLALIYLFIRKLIKGGLRWLKSFRYRNTL